MNNEIVNQVIKNIKDKVVNQIIWRCPDKYSIMPEEKALELLKDTDIISDEFLYNLVLDIGLDELFTDEGWIDEVGSYIIDNKEDCDTLWTYMALH
jgi:hypothetical protein